MPSILNSQSSYYGIFLLNAATSARLVAIYPYDLTIILHSLIRRSLIIQFYL